MCKLCSFDTTKAEAFGEQLIGIMNQGALSLMISVGHRTRLFDTMDKLPPATSEVIAQKAGLQERYVREWLGAMVTGKIVMFNPKDQTYELPSEHAAYLTRKAGSNNVGVLAQYIPVLAYVEDAVVRCFYEGGGVPYEQYNRFHEVMVEDSGLAVISSLINEVLPLVPNIKEKLTAGIRVLDIGCGSGRALNLMAKHFPASTFVGYDLCEEPLVNARREAQAQGLTNVYFEQRDLTYFQPEQPFDFITAFDAIHDQARPDNVLAGVYQALKAGGYYLMVDINASSRVENNMEHPIGPLLYTVSTMHCMTVSLAQGGMGLGTMWGREKANVMLKEAGFSEIREHLLPQDFQNRYYVIRK